MSIYLNSNWNDDEFRSGYEPNEQALAKWSAVYVDKKELEKVSEYMQFEMVPCAKPF